MVCEPLGGYKWGSWSPRGDYDRLQPATATGNVRCWRGFDVPHYRKPRRAAARLVAWVVFHSVGQEGGSDKRTPHSIQSYPVFSLLGRIDEFRIVGLLRAFYPIPIQSSYVIHMFYVLLSILGFHPERLIWAENGLEGSIWGCRSGDPIGGRSGGFALGSGYVPISIFLGMM